MNDLTLETARMLFRLASAYAGRNENAEACLTNFDACLERGWYGSAGRWCVKSLAHSVGIFHPAWKYARKQFPADSYQF